MDNTFSAYYPVIYTRIEAQKLLKIGKRSILKKLQTGELAGYREHNREWRIPEISIQEYVEHKIHMSTLSQHYR